jgi:hypothetical protein
VTADASHHRADADRAALFDLAVERALTYVTRARLPTARDRAATVRALEVWYLKTRFAARVPLDDIVDALLLLPDDDPVGWRWRGGRQGAWQPRPPGPRRQGGS